MRKKFAAFAIAAAVSGLFTLAAFAQNPPSNPDRRTQADIVRDNLEQRMNNMRNLDTLARKRAELESREALKTRYFRPEMTDELKERMEVDPDLLSGLQGLPGTPDAGVIKLIAQQDCAKAKNLKRATDCYQENANIREFANSFSFRERQRTMFGKADLGVTADHLVAGRHSVQTLLVDLGVRDFNAVTSDSPELGYLFSFQPDETAAGMDRQYDDLKKGMTVTNFSDGKAGDRYLYAKSAAIADGHVYALRTIAYRGEQSEASGKDHDVVVVFRIADVDDDSVTIVWKELSRKPGMVMRMEEVSEVEGK